METDRAMQGSQYNYTVVQYTMPLPTYQLDIVLFSGGNVLLAAALVGLIFKTRNLIPKA